jgi:hypothetical protein
MVGEWLATLRDDGPACAADAAGRVVGLAASGSYQADEIRGRLEEPSSIAAAWCERLNVLPLRIGAVDAIGGHEGLQPRDERGCELFREFSALNAQRHESVSADRGDVVDLAHLAPRLDEVGVIDRIETGFVLERVDHESLFVIGIPFPTGVHVLL